MSDSVSDVFSRINDVYNKSYTFTATSRVGLGCVGLESRDFIFLLGLGKGGAVNADTCHL